MDFCKKASREEFLGWVIPHFKEKVSSVELTYIFIDKTHRRFLHMNGTIEDAIGVSSRIAFFTHVLITSVSGKNLYTYKINKLVSKGYTDIASETAQDLKAENMDVMW